MPRAEQLEVRLHGREALGVGSLLEVIFFGDLDDNVHHIREAATAAAHFPQLMVDLGGNDELPWILIEEAANHLFHVARRDDVALANEHPQASGIPGKAEFNRRLVRFVRIVSCRPRGQGPSDGRDYR
jgi:hypothetical protein